MSARSIPRPLSGATALGFALVAAVLLGACDGLLRLGQPDRFIDPHVSCAGGTCTCVDGFDDCDGDEDNGCETDLSTNESHCGACGSSCANGACNGGVCACAPGFVDCDGKASTGCEARLDLDLQNCGACGHDCAGSVCVSGVCQPLSVGGLDGATSIAAEGGFIFVARCGDPAVAFVSEAGGSVTGIGMATGCAGLVSVSDGTVVWATTDAVLSAKLDAPASATELATTTSPERFLAASPTHVYWWRSDTAALERVPIAGGAVEKVADATLSALATGSQLAYWSDTSGIHTVSFDSTVVSDLSPMLARALAAVGDTLFAADAEGIHSITATGETTMLSATTGAQAIAADTTHVYWVDTTDDTVRRIGRDGTELTVLAKGEPFSAIVPPLAIDDRAVYWIADQKVRKVAK